MKTALSPSLTNLQFQPADAGRLTTAHHFSRMANKSFDTTSLYTNVPRTTTPSTPAKKSSSRRKSGRSLTMKRTTSTASIMDAVMHSQAPSDHDVQEATLLSTDDTSVLPPASSTTDILLTPRRGRRLGKVDMGWGSPMFDDVDAITAVPHTLPKRQSRLGVESVAASPSKRKASTAFASELQASHRSLVDTAGWASAAMLSSVPLTEHELMSSPGFSPRHLQSPNLASTCETRDAVAAFVSPLLPQDSKLVPLDVQGLGRVAVHRDFAQQISDHGPVSGLAPSRRYSSGGLYRGSDSGDSSARSDVGSSTDPTSVGTPGPGVSPSFSLSSHFPTSEPSSPAKRLDLCSTDDTAVEPRALASLVHPTTSTDAASAAESASWRPRLRGHRATHSLPTLDWPDSPHGPWSAAGKHVIEAKQKRKQNLVRWLETDTEDELEARLALPAYQHHPMVAKALLDRARKREEPMLAASPLTASPAKRAKRLSAIPTPAKRRGRKPRASAPSISSTRKSVATGASLARSNGSAVFGCKCGIEDDAIIMVQCDNCKHWLHLPCVGINNSNDLDDEWYCDTCCDAAMTEHLSPASSLPTSYADFTTPEGLQALLSGQEPVFTLPSGTPIHRHGLAVSSSIALAPSPTLLSAGDPTGRSTVKRQGLGRSRAERVGWRINEPGSPLARKSTTGSAGIRPAVADTPTKVEFAESSAATSSLLAGWEPMRSTSGSSGKSLLERPMTPSPRLVGMSTPSRHASGRKASGPLSLGFMDEEAVHADVFSTPSRLASGGPWSYRGGQQQHPGSLTPSRSGNRHQRVDSFSGGMFTPGRDFLSGAFATEPSTSMPSLIYSSGYADGLEEHIGGGEHYSNSRAWQLQSPTSATRAVRARQTSGLGTPWSSAQLKTPELQPRQPHTSCIRGRFDSSDDVPPSSSPFPRTPTFDFGSPRFMQRYPGGETHERNPSHLGHGLPSSSSSARLHKAMAGEPTGRHSHLGERSLSVSSGNSASKNRQVSSEVPLGLGIGLDLDDVLDWS